MTSQDPQIKIKSRHDELWPFFFWFQHFEECESVTRSRLFDVGLLATREGELSTVEAAA